MRLTVERDGKAVAVDVSDDLATVRVGERTYPVKIVARSPTRVDLEIGGEVVAVANWPEHFAGPPGPVDVNGERWSVTVRAEGLGGAVLPTRLPTPNTPPAPAPLGPAASAPVGSTPVVPPMPGRVVELRVREGQAVTKGQVLLVLEAMKMRNEVTAPVDGVVRELRVREETNVRARETMLLLVPK